MKKIPVLNLLGIAKKANLLLSGETLVIEAIKKDQAKIVFLAEDSGINTAKKIRNKTKHYQVSLIDCFSATDLSDSIGQKRNVIAITDQGLATKFQELITGN
jgi:ribosomal protein L7Ae-like RNA K-turn-binding protein